MKKQRNQPATGRATFDSERDAQLRSAVGLLGAGRLDEAEALVRNVRRRDPHFAPAAHLLGVIACKTERPDLAIKMLKEAVALDPDAVPSRNELAAMLRLVGQVEESLEHARHAVWLNPDDAGTHNNLGMSLLAGYAWGEAANFFERAAVLTPGIATYHCNLAEALWKLGERDKAHAALRRAGEIETTAPGRLRVAQQMREQGALHDAERLLRRVVAASPSDPAAHEFLGTLLRELGRFEEAAALYRKRIAASPRDAGAYLGLVLTRRMTELDRPALHAAERLIEDAAIPERERARAHYALAKASDDLGRYEAAIRQYDAANRIMADALERSGRKLDKSRHAANIDRMIALFDADFVHRQAETGSDSEQPIFVVGMIRTGTTLVEQILSSHPAIGAGGELPFWGRQGALLAELEAGRPADKKGLLAEEYCALLRRLVPDALRVIDKMPTNYLLLGLMHAVFPRARIIHCRRNPLDTCLSIYFTPFENLPDFAGDRESIAFYYEQYARLMAHWRSVLPAGSMFELDYEALIADREAVVRRLVDFCGVGWDEACLHHEQNARAVATPSMWQVRQPVYRASAGRWRHYADWLGAFERLRNLE